MIKWIVLTILILLSLIATIIAGALRLNLQPGDFGGNYDRVVRWVKAAQIMWAITGTAALVINAMASS